MLIESNYFANAKIDMSLLQGYGGKWQIIIHFDSYGDKYHELPNDTIKNIFGFSHNAYDVNNPDFYWDTFYLDNDEFQINIRIMHDKLNSKYEKFTLIYWICDSIKKLNEEIMK